MDKTITLGVDDRAMLLKSLEYALDTLQYGLQECRLDGVFGGRVILTIDLVSEAISRVKGE